MNRHGVIHDDHSCDPFDQFHDDDGWDYQENVRPDGDDEGVHDALRDYLQQYI